MVTLGVWPSDPAQAKESMGQAAADSQTKVTHKNTSDQIDDSACKGKTIVMMEETFDDGSKVLEQVVRLDNGKDLKHGLTTTYWPDGSKRMEVEYVCGTLHGTKVAYFTDGTRRSVGEYVNGKEQGKWIEWYRDGKKAKQFSMDHGAWNGMFTVWYTNGQKRMEVQYVNGQRQGRLHGWDDKGHLVHQIDYVDNMPQPTPAP